MVTVLNQVTHYAGLSKDNKPTSGVRNGDDFREIDTGKMWYYDEAGTSWIDPTATDESNNTEG